MRVCTNNVCVRSCVHEGVCMFSALLLCINLFFRWVTEVKAARLSAISFNQSAHFTWPRKMCAVGPKKTLLATIKNQKGRNLDQQPNSLYTGSIISPNNENGKLCIRPFLGK